MRLGLECEAFPEFYPWLREMRAEKSIECVVLGNHYDSNDKYNGLYFGRCTEKCQILRCEKATIAGMESDLFVYLAHPALFLETYPKFDADAPRVSRELCETTRRLDMPLEYNLLGAWRNPAARERGCVGYTSRELWEIATETGNRVIIGVDAHYPEMMSRADAHRQVQELLLGMSIEVLAELPGLEE